MGCLGDRRAITQALRADRGSRPTSLGGSGYPLGGFMWRNLVTAGDWRSAQSKEITFRSNLHQSKGRAGTVQGQLSGSLATGSSNADGKAPGIVPSILRAESPHFSDRDFVASFRRIIGVNGVVCGPAPRRLPGNSFRTVCAARRLPAPPDICPSPIIDRHRLCGRLWRRVQAEQALVGEGRVSFRGLRYTDDQHARY